MYTQLCGLIHLSGQAFTGLLAQLCLKKSFLPTVSSDSIRLKDHLVQHPVPTVTSQMQQHSPPIVIPSNCHSKVDCLWQWRYFAPRNYSSIRNFLLPVSLAWMPLRCHRHHFRFYCKLSWNHCEVDHVIVGFCLWQASLPCKAVENNKRKCSLLTQLLNWKAV